MNRVLRRLLGRRSRTHSGDWSENATAQPRSKAPKAPKQPRAKRRGSGPASGDWSQSAATQPRRKAPKQPRAPKSKEPKQPRAKRRGSGPASGDWSQHDVSSSRRGSRLRPPKLPGPIAARPRISALVLVVIVAVAVIVIVSSGGGKKSTETAGGKTTTAPPPSRSTKGHQGKKTPTPESMIDVAKLDPAVNRIKQRLGGKHRLIQVTINDLGVEVEYAAANHPGFLLGEPTSSTIHKVTSQRLQPGTRRTFGVKQLDPSVPAQLRSHAPDVGGSGYKATQLLLKPDPITKKLVWTITDTTNAGHPTLTANPDGSGLKKVG